MKEIVKIVEVGPRDGLQNEQTIVDSLDKVKYIELLMDSGLKCIEATSFVSSKAIPQMGDSKEVFQKVKKFKNFDQFDFPCLVPNKVGLENAQSVGVNSIALFTATSNEFNQKNINASIDQSFERFQEILGDIDLSKIRVRGYISTVFGCPYEGKMTAKNLMPVLERMLKLGLHEISLGDTIGVANPKQVKEIIKEVKSSMELKNLAMHFHDTRGFASANVLASLDNDIRIFDSASGGLGGCPYAKGSSGNVATEDIVYLLHEMGLETGVDLDKLMEASRFILGAVGKKSPSKFYQVKSGQVD